MDKLLYLILFLVGLLLVVLGHQAIGPSGLLTMLLGLSVLISFLWVYNRKYK